MIKKLFTFLGWPLLAIPIFTLYLGAGMNEAVIWANGGRMPVSTYACEERFNAPQPSDEDNVVATLFGMPKAQHKQDYTHKCADKNTKLRWLDDWMIADGGISSPGDMLQESYSDLKLIFYSIWIAGSLYFIYIRRIYYLS